MTTNGQYFPIIKLKAEENGDCVFIWSDASNLTRSGEDFTAVVDFDESGNVLNVELVFFHAILLEVDSLAVGRSGEQVPSLALAYRFGDPIANIRFGQNQNETRVRGHMTASARIMTDRAGNACAISVYDLRDEGGSGTNPSTLRYRSPEGINGYRHPVPQAKHP